MRYNPFNPQVPVEPEFFVGRENELKKFHQNLLQTIYGSPLNMSVSANRGMGKTSILVKMEDLAKKNNCLVFRMSNYEGNVKTIVQLTDYLILGIKQELLDKSILKGKLNDLGDWIKTLKPMITYKEVEFSFEEREIAAQTILRKNFIKIWDEVNKEYPAIVLLIDEAEALEKVEGAFQFLRETFQRLSKDTKYCVVLCGKLNFPERMAESFSPLNRFFPTEILNPLTNEQVSKYIEKKLTPLNVTCDNEVKNIIFEESEGHPYVMVSICQGLFNELKDSESYITKKHFDSGYSKIVKQLERDFFAPMFHPIQPKTQQIMIQIGKDLSDKEFEFSDAVKITKLKSSDVSPYIQEAVRKGILNKPRRAKYIFFHKLFLEYLKRKAQGLSP